MDFAIPLVLPEHRLDRGDIVVVYRDHGGIGALEGHIGSSSTRECDDVETMLWSDFEERLDDVTAETTSADCDCDMFGWGHCVLDEQLERRA